MPKTPNQIAREILSVEIDHPTGGRSDCIGIMLCSFLQDSIYHPEDRTMDEYDTWTQWSADQVDLIEKAITQILEKHLPAPSK